MPSFEEPINLLWLTPDKPADISIGRARLADHLRRAGFTVTIRGTTPQTVLQSLRNGGTYDTLIGTTRAGALAATTVARIHDIPLIIDHVDPIRQFYETTHWPLAAVVDGLEQIAFRLADHILFVYEEERDRIDKSRTPYTQTTLGVDYERFARPSSDAIDEARERLDTNRQIAIYIGGLEPVYEIETMLASSDHLPDWELVIAGTGSLEPTVRRAAQSKSGVIFLGTVPHESIPGYLHAADVGLSLVNDSHTLKLLEYGAAGLPTVQREGAARARFGELLFYTQPEPAAVAKAIEDAAKSDGEALQSFVSRFDWAHVAETYSESIMSVINKRDK
jgi:glycosyltransferase involved in cell wall biosynthesis